MAGRKKINRAHQAVETEIFSALSEEVNSDEILNETPEVQFEPEYDENGIEIEQAQTIKIGRFGKKILTNLYDEESLKRDFKTGPELAKFVYDMTGHSLHLAGLASSYKVACEVLNGGEPEECYISDINPHLNTSDTIPVQPMRELPPRSRHLPHPTECISTFHLSMPHTDSRVKSSTKVHVEFKKYINNTVTYKVLGPVEFRPSLRRVYNKAMESVPAEIECIDPRTPERVIVNVHGNLQPGIGIVVKRAVDLLTVDGSGNQCGLNLWDAFINRSQLSTLDSLENPNYENMFAYHYGKGNSD